MLYHPQVNSFRQCAINGKKVIIMNVSEISRIIEMAWEDRTPFEAIHAAYGLSEPQVITGVEFKDGIEVKAVDQVAA